MKINPWRTHGAEYMRHGGIAPLQGKAMAQWARHGLYPHGAGMSQSASHRWPITTTRLPAGILLCRRPGTVPKDSDKACLNTLNGEFSFCGPHGPTIQTCDMTSANSVTAGLNSGSSRNNCFGGAGFHFAAESSDWSCIASWTPSVASSENRMTILLGGG